MNAHRQAHRVAGRRGAAARVGIALAVTIAHVATSAPTAARGQGLSSTPSVPVNRETPSLTKPLSQLLVTNGDCAAGEHTIQLAETCYKFGTGDLAPAAPHAPAYLVLRRSDLKLLSSGRLHVSDASNVYTQLVGRQNNLFVLSAPNGFVGPSQADDNLLLSFGLGSADRRAVLHTRTSFSLVVMGNCPSCPPAYNVGNVHARPGTSQQAAAKPGQLRGAFQQDSTGQYAFTFLDYVPYRSEYDSQTRRTVFHVGRRTFETDAPQSERHGFAAVNLDASTLALLPPPATLQGNPGLYYSDARGDLLSLSQLLAPSQASRVVLIQAFGSPRPTANMTGEWNRLADHLEALGATRPLFNSLNNPEAPGLNVPTGYAFAAVVPSVFSEDLGSSSEATRAGLGQAVTVSGVFARRPGGDFAPYVGGDAPVDSRLYELVYQDPVTFPFSSTSDSHLVEEVQRRLHQRSGLPLDPPLRDQYWARIRSSEWPSHLVALTAIADQAASEPVMSAVIAQLRREFSALITVRTVLISTDGLAGALDFANESAQPAIALIAQTLAATIDQTRKPPKPSILDILSSVFTIVSGAAGFFPGLGAFAQAQKTIDTIEKLGNFFTMGSASVAAAGGAVALASTLSPEPGDSAQYPSVEAAAAAIGQDVANKYRDAIIGLSRLAETLASDYGKLVVAAEHFRSHAAYDLSHTNAFRDVADTFAQATRQAIFRSLLSVAAERCAVRYPYSNEAAFYLFDPDIFGRPELRGKPTINLGVPAPASQEITRGYANAEGVLTPHTDKLSFVIRPKSGSGSRHWDAIRPSQSLVAALFNPGLQSVGFGGSTILGAGLDPETFLYRLPDRPVEVIPPYSRRFLGVEFYNRLRTMASRHAQYWCETDPFYLSRFQPATGAAIRPMRGDGMAAEIAFAFPAPPSARVTTPGGHPIAGTQVSFSAPGGLSGAIPARVRTGTDGVAEIPGLIAAGDVPGHYLLSAVAGFPATGDATATFNLWVTRVPSTTTLRAEPGGKSTVGQPVVMTANVAARVEATGHVRFESEGVAIPGCDRVAIRAGATTAECRHAFPRVGVRNVSLAAAYLGADLVAPSRSQPLPHEVLPAPTAIRLETSVVKAEYGQGVRMVAFVAAVPPGGGDPPGPIVFSAGDQELSRTPLGSPGGAEIVVDWLPAGRYEITARYPGTADYLASASASVSLEIVPATTVLLAEHATYEGDTPSRTVTVQARLLRAFDGFPIPDETITFSYGGLNLLSLQLLPSETLCLAETSLAGFARCTGQPDEVSQALISDPLNQLANGSYTASFGGGPNFAPTVAKGQL